jgi:D-aminoacyl-tRNA deacylase
MKYAIIISTTDKASMNIKERLLETGEFTKANEKFDAHDIYEHKSKNACIFTTDRQSIRCEKIDEEIPAEKFIFATRHQSETGTASLTVHAPGNWGEAAAGGNPHEVQHPMQDHMKEALAQLSRRASIALPDFEAAQEATHHGPSLSRQCMFIEIGSDEERWLNKKAGEIIAATIINLINTHIKKNKAALILGGGHYNQLAKKMMERTDYAVGHICTKHSLAALDLAMLNQAMKKYDSPVTVVLDWKGLGTEKQRIVQMLDENSIEYVRSDKIEK